MMSFSKAKLKRFNDITGEFNFNLFRILLKINILRNRFPLIQDNALEQVLQCL